MTKKLSELCISTKSIHVGNSPDPVTGSVSPAIHLTSTFIQKSPGNHLGYEYSRTHNPTRDRLQECLASLENAKYCITTSSGMSAITLVLEDLPPGSNILCGDDVYGGTYRLLTTVYKHKLNTKFIDTTDTNHFLKTIKDENPHLIWIETPTNPMLKITDLSKVITAAKINKSLVVVDNTFMTPCFQRPLDLGADFVVHSLTKYINGHSDSLGGAIILNNKKCYLRLNELQNSIGPSLSPFESWLILRGVKTLDIRMKAHEENAMAMANFFKNHRHIKEVIYPGLKSHPQHSIAKKQMFGFGGMISIKLKGNRREVLKFIRRLKLFSLAESLGGVESLIEIPAIMTHASIPLDKRLLLGITESLIRISVGIENKKDLIADLTQALNHTFK